MAGRILPLAAAIGIGVSIGIATFDGEFKEQRRKRLQEEYERYLTASLLFTTLSLTIPNSEVAALKSQSLTPIASNAIAPPSPQNNPNQPKTEGQVSKAAAQQDESSWSSYLGLWAWKKNTGTQVAPEGNAPAPTPPQSKVDEKAGKP